MSKKPSGEGSGCSLGITFVTLAALIFGLVAAMVKLAGLNPLLMLQCRSLVQWIISLIFVTTSGTDASAFNRMSGPPHLRHYVILRAFIYWGFMALWWAGLTLMPIGDATAIVFCAPILTTTSAIIFLREAGNWMLLFCICLNGIGAMLISKPNFLFPNNEPSEESYSQGLMYVIFSLVIGSQLPILIRLAKDVHWSAIEHVTAFLSCFLFTPSAIFICNDIPDNIFAFIMENCASLGIVAAASAFGVSYVHFLDDRFAALF